MSDQKNSRSKGSDASKRDFTARRRLLKASAAAPLIATLNPSAALAQTSLTCAMRDTTDATLQSLPKVNEFSDDKAVRVQGLDWTNRNGKVVWEVNGVPYASDGGEVPVSWHNRRGFEKRHKWTSKPCWFRQQFAVLDDGTVQSLGVYPEPEANDGMALSDSCWASIAVSGQFTING